jgi:hypothetical protein
VPAANPAGYADTVRVPGVVPPVGLTETHDPPYTEAVKVDADPLLRTERVFGDGVSVPSAKNTRRFG